MNKSGLYATRHSASNLLSTSPRILQRKCACGNHTAGGGECDTCTNKQQSVQREITGKNAADEIPRIVHKALGSSGQSIDRTTRTSMESQFARDFTRVRLRSSLSASMQSQLAIGRSDDRFEQEADQIAERVAGQHLSTAAENDVAIDFGSVRIHTDASAAQSARAVGAKAYTVGPDIVFGAGQYEPHSDAGRRLLAHELTHVVQQTGAGSPSVSPARDGILQRQQDAGLPGGVPQSAPFTSATAPTYGTTPIPASPRTYAFSVTLNDCEVAPYNRATVMAAAGTAFNTVLNSGCVHSATLKDEILNEFDGLNIDCEQKGDDCGMASRYFTTTVNIYPPALTPSCGPLASTILHEVVHLTEWRLFGHGDLADACESSCFGFGGGDASKCR